MKMYNILLSGLLACLCACNCATEKTGDSEPATPDVPEAVSDVTVYVTTADKSRLFVKSSLEFDSPASMSPYQVTYDKTRTAQEIDGFGLAVTTASCYNLLQMSQADRTAFLKETFSMTEGIGSSLIRVSIGASDFCLADNYTWCDTEGLENFAVHQEDRDYLFPILREIYAINPDVKIIGSPWSCPLWMKCAMPGGDNYNYRNFNVAVTDETTYESWTGGRLKPSCYDDYAQYFVKWIQTMEKEGFDIYAITMQNEPLNPGNSMSMVMPWQDQKEFIKVLGPEMENVGLGDVKILLYDHNYDYDNRDGQSSYPLNIYADPEARKWADGSAWHNYGGDVSELDEIYAAYPGKGIWFTEASIGTWNYDSGGIAGGKFDPFVLDEYSRVFLGTMKRGGKGVTYWNLMLDDKKGPYSRHDGSCKTCYGGVTINSSDYRTITRNAHWYHVAHASSVIRPGARKMETDGFSMPAGFECQMYLNPDNTVGAVICNRNKESQTIVFTNDEFSVRYTVPEKSLVSLIWNEK